VHVPELTEVPKIVIFTVILEMVDTPPFTALHWRVPPGASVCRRGVVIVAALATLAIPNANMYTMIALRNGFM
jgi:hypothetical protein